MADEERRREAMVSVEIGEVVARWTGIPVSRLNQSDRDRLLHLEAA